MSPSITTVGIVTRDRPARLAACLESYAANCRRHGRDPDFVIFDDSRDAAARRLVSAALRNASARWKIRTRYCGVDEKTAAVSRLAAASNVAADVVRFALFGDDDCEVTVGANRNAFLLDTVGECAFSADDDTLCHPADAPDAADGIESFSGFDPTEFRFFPTRDEALAQLTFRDIDLLGTHESILGEQGAVAMHGLAGDSGMGSPRYLLGLEGSSFERLTSSVETYRSALRSREVVRSVRRTTVATGGLFMSTFYGFDHRQLLPPFVPIQRNEDGTFGLMLQLIGGSPIVHLPTLLEHAPEPRWFDDDSIWLAASRARFTDIVIDSLMSRPAADLETIGLHFQDLGRLALPDFRASMLAIQQQRAIAAVTVLQNQLHTRRHSPGFWAADVQRLVGILMAASSSHEAIVPADLPPAGGLLLAQNLIRRYGELLVEWPAIVAAAAELRSRGIRISEPLVSRE